MIPRSGYRCRFQNFSTNLYIKKKSPGSRNPALQVSFWHDISLLMKQQPLIVEQPCGIDVVSLESHLLADFRLILLEYLGCRKVKLYKRFKDKFITYHSTLYDKLFKFNSHIISYKERNSDQIVYVDCIIFIEFNDDYYVFINKYTEAAPNDRLSARLQTSDSDNLRISEQLDSMFSMQTKSNSFGLLSMSRVRHKCVSVSVKDFCCLTEIRNDFEHD